MVVQEGNQIEKVNANCENPFAAGAVVSKTVSGRVAPLVELQAGVIPTETLVKPPDLAQNCSALTLEKLKIFGEENPRVPPPTPSKKMDEVPLCANAVETECSLGNTLASTNPFSYASSKTV